MDLLTPLVNAYPMLILTILVVFYMRGRFDQVDKRLDDTNRRIEDTNRRIEDTNRRIDDVNNRVDLVATELVGLRSDVTYIALAVGARTRPEAGTA